MLAGTLRLALIGFVLGAAASLAAARLIASLLFATSPWDVGTYFGMSAALLAVAAVSGYIPAFRASRINPIGGVCALIERFAIDAAKLVRWSRARHDEALAREDNGCLTILSRGACP